MAYDKILCPNSKQFILDSYKILKKTIFFMDLADMINNFQK